MLKTPLTLMRRKPTMLIFLYVLFALIYGTIFLFVFPSKTRPLLKISIALPNEIWFYIISSAVILMVFFAVISSCKNPGYLQKPDIPFLVRVSRNAVEST